MADIDIDENALRAELIQTLGSQALLVIELRAALVSKMQDRQSPQEDDSD